MYMSKNTGHAYSFADILRDKIEALSTHEDTSPVAKKTSTESVNFQNYTDFHSRIGAERSFFRGKNTIYYTKKTAVSPKIQREKTIKPALPRYEIGQLSAAAQLALVTLGFVVTPGQTQFVTASEVKRAFRKFARQTHPDLNSHIHSTTFIALKEAADIVLAELKTLAAAATSNLKAA